MRFCEQCGKQISDDARFCGHCGARQMGPWEDSPETETPSEENPPKAEEPAVHRKPAESPGKKPAILIPVIVVAVAALCVIGFFLISGLRSSDAGKDYEEMEEAITEVEPADMRFVSADVSDFPSVKIYVSCESNGSVLTLTSPTARIRESISGGAEIERTVRSIEQLEGNQGIGIELVTDKSGSMQYDLGTMQNVMTDFIDNMDFAAGDKAEIISFDTYIMYMCDYTGDAARLKTGISNMTAYGETALYDALVLGINNAGSRPGANCVIAFTDGEDNYSVNTYNEVIRLALEKGIPVYIIGTAYADEGTLREICGQTGGNYWNVSNLYDISEIYDTIYSLQKDMYCIEYETDADSDAYAERSISCILKDKVHGCEFRNVVFTAVKKQEAVKHASRYEIVREDITWTEANEKAHAKGGHLVTITSESEEQQMEQLAADAGIRFVWLGGYTSVRNNLAFGHWTTGEDFTYSKWYPGEPSRNDRDGTPESYLMLWNPTGNWSWNDQRNDVVHSGLKYFPGNVGYIIEYEE